MASKKLINISNLQKFLLKLNEKFALKKAMKGISEDFEGNIIIGEEGLVPAPNENSKGKFLRSDGEWALPSETAVYDSMTIEEGVAGVSEVDKVLNAKNLKQIVNSDGFLTSLDSSKLTGIINIENLPQGALERILIVSSKEERLTLSDTEVQLGDVVKEADTGLMYYVINTEKLNSEEGYTQFTAGMASSVPWGGVTNKPTIPTKTSELTNDSNFAIDSNVVHKSGNEEISGIKTFTNGTWVKNNSTTSGYSVKNTAIARNEVPSQLYHATFRTYDKNDKIMGEYCIEKSTTGDALLNMGVRSEDDSGTQIAYGLQFRMTNDGSLVRFMPSANNKVHLGDVNAKWAKIYSDDVVHTSGDETIAGVKTFTASPFVSNYAVTNGFFTKLNTIARNEVPSQIYHSAFRVFDKNAKTLGEYCVEKSTSGSSLLHMDVHTEDSEGNDIMESVYLNLSNDGSTVSFHPAKDNRIDLGTPHYKWAKVYSDDVVHTSGNEHISGTKWFSNTIHRYADLTTSGAEQVYRFVDTNANSCGHIYNNVHWHNNAVYNRHGSYNAKSGKTLELDLITNNLGRGTAYISGNVTDLGNLTDATHRIDERAIATMGWVNNPATSTNVVHRSGDEYIHGTKIFSGVIHRYADITTSGGEQVYRFDDTNANGCGHIFNNAHWAVDTIINSVGAYNKKSGKTTEIHIVSNDAGGGMAYVEGSARKGNLETATSETGHTGIATMGWVNNPATSTNVVHRSGNEYIGGIKSFSDLMYIYNNISNKNSQMDLFTTPANTLYAHYMFVDKNNEVSAYMQYGQQNSGTDFIGLFIHDKNRSLHGIQVTTNNEVIPISNNTYGLGSSTNKWANVYATTFNGNSIKFPSDYYITTDANDNSLRIIRHGTNHGNNYKIIIQGDTGKIFAPNGFIGNLQGNADSSTKAVNSDYATSAGSAGNGIDSSGINYVKFKDGTQICWGANKGGIVTFANAFTTTPSITFGYNIASGIDRVIHGQANYSSSTSFIMQVWDFKSNTWVQDRTVEWIAIGRWK